MEFLDLQEKVQLQQILTNRTMLRTADADLRSGVLSNCGLGKYSALLPLDPTSFQLVVSLCAKLSEVYITVEHSERLGLIVFLEYLSQIDLNLSAEDREFLEYVIAKWNLEQKNSSGNVLSLEQTNLPVRFTHVLHLSDLHFGTPDQANLWSNQLAEDLLNCSTVHQLSQLRLVA